MGDGETKRATQAMQCCSVELRLTFKYALQHKPLIEFLSDCNNKINSSLEFLLLGKERRLIKNTH